MINFDAFKNKLSKFKTDIKEIKYTDFLMCVLISFVLTFVLEALARHSVALAFSFMIYHVGFFLSNFSIILCSVVLCLFFKRRYFVLSLVLLLWMALGVTNAIILTYRNTPLAAVDFSIVKSALDIMNAYVKPIQLVTILSITVVAIVVIVLVLKKAPKVVPNLASATVYGVFSAVLCIIAMVSSYTIYNNPECFANLPEAYKNYGFVYSFSCSAVNRGVDKPAVYDEQTVGELTNKIDETVPTLSDPSVKPNIIYVQLESFFDVNKMKDVVYNKNPLPVYTKLKEENSSGYLRIPGLGGGTCNAEFEVLTGMSVGMFGTCEYPYKTITLGHTTDSVCYDLKNYGYSTHAVHNHTGTFYDRHRNYANLGFDTFIPVEYMHDVERNPINWAKDKILTSEIFKCLKSTDGRDFVFAVSVQSHGKYPTEVIDENQPIKVESGFPEDGNLAGFEYFVNQLHEMDMFAGELVEAVKKFSEPTVVVFYGDHLPAMSISKEQLENEDLFETEYVVCANFDLPVVDEDLYAYQLNSRVTQMLGFNGNYVNKLHRYYKEDKDNPVYRDDLQMLMYDQLYGSNFAYGGEPHILPTEIKYGIDPIYIEHVSVGTTATTIKGTGFTEKSKVYINGVVETATYVDTNTMIISSTAAKVGDEIFVAQRCSDKHILGKTEVYTVTEANIIS